MALLNLVESYEMMIYFSGGQGIVGSNPIVPTN